MSGNGLDALLHPISSGPAPTWLVTHAHVMAMDGGFAGARLACVDGTGTCGWTPGPTGGASTFVSYITGASGVQVSGPTGTPVVSLSSYTNTNTLSLGNASGPIASTAYSVVGRVVDGIATVRFPTLAPTGNGVTGTIVFSSGLTGPFLPAGNSDTMIIPISTLNNAVAGVGTCNIGVPTGSVVITANIAGTAQFFGSSTVGFEGFSVSYPC